MLDGQGESGAATERRAISRRDALKRGAVAGGAVLWVSPIVQNIGISSAWAQSTSPPPGHEISFIAFRFTCGSTTYFAKLENFTPGDQDGTCTGSVSNPAKNSCGVSDEGATSGCGTGLYTVQTTFVNGEAVLITVTLSGNCTFVAGATKCGTAFGGCHDASINGNQAVFVCP